MAGVLIALWFFLALGFALFSKVWLDAYAISPVDPQSAPARFQA